MTEVSKDLLDATFGTQLDKLAQRHTYFTHFFWKRHEIGTLKPELKGLENKLVTALGNAVAERMQLMQMYGSGGLAAEIIESRRDPSKLKDIVETKVPQSQYEQQH